MVNKCARDERGWRIPRAGTNSYMIYHLVVAAFKRREIVKLLGIDSAVAGVLIYRIKRPEHHNRQMREWVSNSGWVKRHRARLNAAERARYAKDSPYVHKLVRTMGIPIAYARAIEKGEKV